MPEHTNAMSPMIFGGSMFSEMDLCAANTVRRALYESKTCEAAVTHKAEVIYHMPCYLGDLLFLTSKIEEVRKKSLRVSVKVFREKCDKGTPILRCVATGEFVFVTVKAIENLADKPELLPYAHHGLPVSK